MSWNPLRDINLANAIKSDPRANKEYHRTRTEKQLLPLNLPNVSNKYFTFTFLNVRPQQTFNWYIMWQRITRDRYFMSHRNTDFAESDQSKNRRILTRISAFLNKSNDKYKRLAFYTRDSKEIDNLCRSPGRSSFFGLQSIYGFLVEKFTSLL